MAKPRCPGQDTRYWKPEDIFDVACPACGNEIEFWKDEPMRRCPACRMEVSNPKVDLGCAEWCNFAEQCIGTDRAAAFSEALVRDRIIAEVRTAIGGDETRFGRTLRVLEYAEQLREGEGGDALTVRAAALLLHIDDREASALAGGVLDKLGVEAGTTAHVCRIIESFRGGGEAVSLESQIVRDADQLSRMSVGPSSPTAAFETQSGRELAEKILTRV